MPQWLVIGISGITCGGKTTLAHNLREYFQNQRHVQLWNTPFAIADVQMISQDDYFLPVDDLRHKWNDKLNVINFEVLSALDMKQMLSDITWTMKGRYLASEPMDSHDYLNGVLPIIDKFATPINPYYQNHFNHHAQFNQRRTSPSHIIRMNPPIGVQMCDNKINILIIEGFMIFNQPELLTLCNIKFHFHLPYEKCFQRRQLRTYDPPDVIGYFEICVWPHYEKNSADFRNRKDIIFLNGEVNKEKICKFALQKIVSYFEDRWEIPCPPPHKLLSIPVCNNGNMVNPCPME